jgi:NADPH:quinone reductase-like Zn-dependent oxidoreductase
MIQDSALPSIRIPVILGEDISGTVVSTGNAVTRFKANDRVPVFTQGDFRRSAYRRLPGLRRRRSVLHVSASGAHEI